MKEILVIDDDEMICRIIERLSHNEAVRVTCVRNGKEARNVLQCGKKFDMVFLDLILPYISGWDVLTVIKNDPEISNTPVVVLTGLSMSEEEVGRLQDRVKTIINKKSFNMDQITQLLKTA